jgi:hypothetical protein
MPETDLALHISHLLVERHSISSESFRHTLRTLKNTGRIKLCGKHFQSEQAAWKASIHLVYGVDDLASKASDCARGCSTKYSLKSRYPMWRYYDMIKKAFLRCCIPCRIVSVRQAYDNKQARILFIQFHCPSQKRLLG